MELAASWEKNGQDPRKDFVYWLGQGKDPVTGEGFSKTDMLTDLRVLIIAGSDTSATTIAAAFDLLSKNPQTLEKLQTELRQTFTNVDDIVTGPRLSGCRYLRAVIDESLRLAPPVPSSLPREIQTEGTTIDGILLPIGTQVGTAAWGIQRSPEYFDSPLSFKPERWLLEYSSKEEIDRAKTAFCAFSLGNRGCIGKNMAYNELNIALGRALWRFDIRRTQGDNIGTGSDGLYAIQDAFVARRAGPLIEFREHF